MNKCITQLMNLRKKYSEITGGISIYRSPDKSRIMGAGRREGGEGEDDVENGEVTMVERVFRDITESTGDGTKSTDGG